MKIVHLIERHLLDDEEKNCTFSNRSSWMEYSFPRKRRDDFDHIEWHKIEDRACKAEYTERKLWMSGMSYVEYDRKDILQHELINCTFPAIVPSPTTASFHIVRYMPYNVFSVTIKFMAAFAYRVVSPCYLLSLRLKLPFASFIHVLFSFFFNWFRRRKMVCVNPKGIIKWLVPCNEIFSV